MSQKECLNTEEDSYQGEDEVWRICVKNWVSICQCEKCREIQRKQYLKTLRGMSQAAKEFVANL